MCVPLKGEYLGVRSTRGEIWKSISTAPTNASRFLVGHIFVQQLAMTSMPQTHLQILLALELNILIQYSYFFCKYRIRSSLYY